MAGQPEPMTVQINFFTILSLLLFTPAYCKHIKSSQVLDFVLTVLQNVLANKIFSSQRGISNTVLRQVSIEQTSFRIASTQVLTLSQVLSCSFKGRWKLCCSSLEGSPTFPQGESPHIEYCLKRHFTAVPLLFYVDGKILFPLHATDIYLCPQHAYSTCMNEMNILLNMVYLQT